MMPLCVLLPSCSLEEATSFAIESGVDGFLAVGGGSVMDTAKAANLYSCHPEKELMDFVNAPIGKGETPTNRLKPLICGMSGYHKICTKLRWQLCFSFSAHYIWDW